MRKVARLPGGRRLLLSIGDIQEEPVDAIVNAANSHLAHGGGVAAAISRAAGPALDEECFAYVRDHGLVPAGGAVVTTAGRLPQKGVIHAVGPARGDEPTQEKLAKAIASALHCANARGWTSVAIPGISSGIFGVPARVCAKGYLEGVLKHLAEWPQSSVQEIRLTLWAGAQRGDLVEYVEAEMATLADRLCE